MCLEEKAEENIELWKKLQAGQQTLAARDSHLKEIEAQLEARVWFFSLRYYLMFQHVYYCSHIHTQNTYKITESKYAQTLCIHRNKPPLKWVEWVVMCN